MARTIGDLTLFVSLVLASILCLNSLSPQALSQTRIGFPKDSQRAVMTGLDHPSAEGRSRQTPLRISVDLVLVPVTVTDALNHPQTNLSREDFKIY